MAALEEVIVLNGTMTTPRMTLAAIVRDTSPRISRWRIPTPLEEAMAEVVRRKPGTTPAATEEAKILMAAANEAVMVADAIIRRIMMTMTRPMVLRD